MDRVLKKTFLRSYITIIIRKATTLGFALSQKTSISIQKFDDLSLEIYSIVLVKFSLQNSLGIVWFFEEIFLLANTSKEVVLKIPIFFLNNTDIEFAK